MRFMEFNARSPFEIGDKINIVIDITDAEKQSNLEDKKMNIKEFAKLLDGRKYRSEITNEEKKLAKGLGFVVVFGASDDLTELYGAIDDEFDCYEGDTAYFTEDGLFEECECECKYSEIVKKKAKKITAIWCGDSNGFTWSYKTDIPHVCFDIFNDGEKYCRGIVFDLNKMCD